MIPRSAPGAALAAVMVAGAVAFGAIDFGGPDFTGTIDRIVDGDTIHVDGAPVRLWGIDCPELSTPLGQDARRFATRWLLGSATACTVKQAERSHGRIVAQCVAVGSDIGDLMVASGLCRDWPAYSGGHYARRQP